MLILLFAMRSSSAQSPAADPVSAVLAAQVRGWNQGNILGFMDTYWHSDSLIFIGKSGILYGWQATLDRYRAAYPGKAGMGNLRLEIVREIRPSPRYALVIGNWHLDRKSGKLDGSFSLLLQKIRGKWLIIADHSS